MTLNDFYYFNIVLALICILVFIACFIRFVYKELGGVKVGKDSFLFFDFILFGSGWKSDIPALSMAAALFFGNSFDYMRNHDITTIHINAIGFFAAFSLFVHCRFFSGIIYNGQKVKFIKELFLNLNSSPKYISLWLSRILYMIFVICVYRS
ncbi:hypothetical protein CUN67_29810 (plasmid) [Pantoea cypripedii]|uniref:Uncharacterized protein n=1 Tax=Pantoea cypripedii TaxID=55209 RepID=A0A6B9GB58_PANCY|nr:hypothetical protein CUN67_29810 [Pantoea cypripedii]